MADFAAITASNAPKVKDPEAVEQIIARYFRDPELNVGISFDHDKGDPHLFLYGHVWPEAWKLPDGVHPDEFDPYGNDQYAEGADGFVELLKALSPFLVEPLTVQAIGSTKCHFPLSASEWHIEPAAGVQLAGYSHERSVVVSR